MKANINKSSNILGIETCTNVCSVAIWNGSEQIMLDKLVTEARSHSKVLLPMIDSLLKEVGILISNIDYVACSVGPGSFVGVRIGVGVAKGIAYGQNIPIIPVSPLSAIAYEVMQIEKTNSVTSLIDARMGEVYSATYKNSKNLPYLVGKELLVKIDNIDTDSTVFAGTGVTEFKQELLKKGAVITDIEFPKAANIINLAIESDIKPVSSMDLSPVYLRNNIFN